MSLEILETVDKLARIVVQKNNELEAVRKNYEQKIDESIRLFEALMGAHTVGCKCDDPEYAVVSKQDIKQLVQKLESLKALPVSAQSIAPVSKPNVYVSPHHSEKKKPTKLVCSFCSEVGHTRAKCHQRLITPLKQL